MKYLIEHLAKDYLKDATPETIKYFKLALENFGKKQRAYGAESACQVVEDYDRMSTQALRVSDSIRAKLNLMSKKEIRKNVKRTALTIEEVMEVAELTWASEFEKGNYHIPGPVKTKFLEAIKDSLMFNHAFADANLSHL